METLYTTEVPTGSFDDGSPISCGTACHFLADGWVYGHRFYGHPDLTTPAHDETYTGQLWQITAADDAGGGGTKLVEQLYGAVAPGWNQILYADPVAVTAGVAYRTVYHSQSGLYTAYSHQFQSAGLTSGNIVAYQNEATGPSGTVRNGTYNEPNATTNSFPIDDFQGGAYMSDLLFSTEPPNTGAAHRFMSFF